MTPPASPSANAPMADAYKSWFCFLAAQILAVLIFRQNLNLELLVIALAGLGGWFAVRAIRLGPLKALGWLMLVFNALLVAGAGYSLVVAPRR